MIEYCSGFELETPVALVNSRHTDAGGVPLL